MLEPDIVNEWARLVQAEYAEFPRLHLTQRQIRRLWSLDESTCDRVIAVLQSHGFLRQTASGAYVRQSQ